jgi:hypothetical protein
MDRVPTLPAVLIIMLLLTPIAPPIPALIMLTNGVTTTFCLLGDIGPWETSVSDCRHPLDYDFVSMPDWPFSERSPTSFAHKQIKISVSDCWHLLDYDIVITISCQA